VGQTIAGIVMPGEKASYRDTSVRQRQADGHKSCIRCACGCCCENFQRPRLINRANFSPRHDGSQRNIASTFSSVRGTGSDGENSRRRCDGTGRVTKTGKGCGRPGHSGNNELDRAPDGRANHAKLDDRAAIFSWYESSMQEQRSTLAKNWDRQLKKRKACESRTRTSSWLLQRESW